MKKVAFDIEQDVFDKIERLAKKEDRKISPMIRVLLKEALTKRKLK